MNHIKQITLVTFIILQLFNLGFCQNHLLDSLKLVLYNSEKDSSALKTYEAIVKESSALDSVSYYSKKGMEFAKALGDIKSYAYLSNLLISRLYYHQKYEDAIDVSNEVLEYAKKFPDSLNIARSYYNLGLFQRMLNNYDIAIDNYKQSIAIYESIKDSFRLTQVLAGIGGVYGIIEENDIAMNFYVEGLGIAEETENWEDAALICNGIGVLFYHQKQFNKAINYHQEAYAHAEKISDVQYMLNALINLGAAYISLENYEKAIEIHEKALELSSKNGFQGSIASAHDNLGTSFKRIGKMAEAQFHYEKALEIRRSQRDKRKILGSLNNLGLFYYDNKNYTKSKVLYAEADKLLNSIDEKELSWAIYKGYGDVLWKLEDYEKSKSLLDIAFDVRDSMFTENQMKAINIAEQKYKTRKQQDSIEHLLETIDLRKKDLQKQETISILSSIIASLGLITVGLLWYYLRLRKDQNEFLQSSNQTLVNLNEELSTEITEMEKELVSPELYFNKTITLTSNGKEIVKLGDILFIKAEGKGVRVFTKTKSYWDWQYISTFKTILPDAVFLQVHRSYIINMYEVKKRRTRLLTMSNDEEINIGITFRENVGIALDKIQA